MGGSVQHGNQDDWSVLGQKKKKKFPQNVMSYLTKDFVPLAVRPSRVLGRQGREGNRKTKNLKKKKGLRSGGGGGGGSALGQELPLLLDTFPHYLLRGT